jgi:hypothetical protein
MSLIRSAILRTLIVGAAACLSAGGASAATIYSDNFDGAGNVAGNTVPGWTSYEQNSGGVSLIDYGSPHHLVMALTGQQSGQPDAAAAAGIISTAGYTNITISFDWLRKGTESSDSFYFSYIVNPGTLNSSLMQNEGAWTTTQISVGGNDTNFATINPVINLANASNSNIAIMFWSVSNGSCSFSGGFDCDTDYFKVDNVVVAGTPNATPLPAALPLFASGLGVLGVLGWRRKKKVIAA